MAVSGGAADVNQWEIEATHQHGPSATAQATFMGPTNVSNNVLCVPTTMAPSSPPNSATLCLLPPAKANISPTLECVICGQSSNETFSKVSQLAPFSQGSPVELTGIPLEESSVCHSCAGLFQRVDYHYMLAKNIRQGLKICADARHISQVPGDFIQLRCSLCPVGVSDSRALSAHLSSHLQGGRLPCAACGRSFSGWQTLRRHALAVHQGALLSRCRRCPAAFNSSAKLVAHKLAQHGAAESLRRHRCPVCRRRFAQGHRYAAHLRSHGAEAAVELRRTLAALASGRTPGRGSETAPADPTAPPAVGAAVAEVQTTDGEVGTRNDAAMMAQEDGRTDLDEEWRGSDEEWRDYGEDEAADEPPPGEDEDTRTPTNVSDPTAQTDVLESALTAQAAVSDSDPGFRCDQCDKVFKRKQSLDRHIGAVHNPPENLKCDECGKSFSIKFYWQKHMNRHRDKQEQCSKCRRQFVNSRALKRHKCVADDLPELPTPTPAPVTTPASAPTPTTAAVAVGGDDGGSCLVCQQRLAAGDADQLNPDDPRPLVPCTCGRTPPQPTGDAVSSGPVDQRQFTCETCGESFATLSRLSVHNRSHREPRAHVCRTCSAVFPTAPALRKHSSQHRERSYQCSVCGKCFRWKNNLDIHVRIHADERPYQCDICGHATRCSANLRLHKQRVHSAQRPHVCPTCQKAFKERYNLVIHMRSHTGERPYVCECCGDGFITKGKLNSHMTKHSEQRPHECPLCLKAFKTSAILGKHSRKVHGMTVDEAVARVGQPPPPPPPPPPPETVPLGQRLEPQHYLAEFVVKQ